MTSNEIKVSYDKLIDLFTKRTDHLFVLTHPLGKGYVQVFDLEKGLQARFWNCCFVDKLNLSNDHNSTGDSTYFTLAFFLNTRGILFDFGETVLRENLIWDTILISNASRYKVCLDPMTRGYCLSISFSRKWLENTVFKQGESYSSLKLYINAAESLSIRESMTKADKEQTKDLMSLTLGKDLGTFYIKSYVLRLICNFFSRIKDGNIFAVNKVSAQSSVAEVEKFLNENVLYHLPNLKHLARSLSMSESTLLRHFKKRHGVNVSSYFIQKKMKYASELLLENKMTMKEIASLLNYKNLNNFKSVFRKYHLE